MENTVNLDVKELKTYEVGYLLSPFFPVEKVEESMDAMYKSVIESTGGVIVFKTTPKMRALAYPVSKFISNKKSTYSDAYFGAVKFQTTPDAIKSIKAEFEKNNEIIRFLIVSVPKNSERTVPVSRPMAKRVRGTATREEGVEKGNEMTKEDIDKEIEGLLDSAASAS